MQILYRRTAIAEGAKVRAKSMKQYKSRVSIPHINSFRCSTKYKCTLFNIARSAHQTQQKEPKAHSMTKALHSTIKASNSTKLFADRKSQGGYIFGRNGCGPISWQSRKQDLVAASTLEAEYIACSEASREARWLIQLRNDVNGSKQQQRLHTAIHSLRKPRSFSYYQSRGYQATHRTHRCLLP